MVTKKSKRYFFRDSYTLCLCWMHWFLSHLIYFSLTIPTMQQCFHSSAKHLIHRWAASLLVLLDILFVLEVKLGTFLPIHRCAFGFNLKYIFVLFNASRTLRMNLLIWCILISLAGIFRVGSGLKFVKIFRGCMQNFFISLRATTFFFRDVDLLCSTR